MASVFSAIGKIFGGNSGGSVLGVDIGTSSAKIVQIRSDKEKSVLETYGEIALGPYKQEDIGRAVKLSPEEMTQALLDLIKEANVTAGAAGISIPFAASLVTILDMPHVTDEQLKRIIPIEARKYVPVPMSEVMLDWFVLPRRDDHQDAFDRVNEESGLRKKGDEVLLAAIHNETLNNYQKVAKAVNLNVNFFEIEIFSATRSSIAHGIEPVLLVDMGATTTKMYIVERGVVRTSHLVSIGSQAMTERLARVMSWSFEKAERAKREWGLEVNNAYSREENEMNEQALLSTLTRIFSEMNRVLLNYGKRYNKNVSKVMLTGGGASLPGLAAVAKEYMKVEVEMARPFDKVEAPAFLDDVLASIGPGFAVAVGVALRSLRQLS